jgi:PleD family two-component response regulator
VPDERDASDDRRPILDGLAFRHRLDEEVARVCRSGGFLSLALIQVEGREPTSGDATSPLTVLGERLRQVVRMQDVLAERAGRLALLMPDTTAREGARAAERLLGLVARMDEGGAQPLASAGVATTYADVEGGGAALLAAAEDALREAGPGQIMSSRALNGRPRILVVDDDLTFAEVLAETISERDWEGHPCTDVADARRRVKEVGYSGLFIDIVLPSTSGVQILREALAAHPKRPAVLMSGQDADHQSILDALSLGPVMFVRKPLTQADLDGALHMFRELIPGVQRGTRRRP